MTKDNEEKTADLTTVVGYIAVKDLATAEMKVAVLSRLGYSNSDMAKICGTSSDVIKTLKSKVKKGK